MKLACISLFISGFAYAAPCPRDEVKTDLGCMSERFVCKVKVCNKLERFTLSLWKHMKDSMGEVCMDGIVPAEQARSGTALSSESRWYQGSFNPTKKSVTRVKHVYKCLPPEDDPWGTK